MSTQAQLSANQKNAQLSTGPSSETGKAKSSLNAVKTGLTGRTVLLPGGDAALYEAHVSRFIERYQPAGDEEQNLVRRWLIRMRPRFFSVPKTQCGMAIAAHSFA